MFRVNPKTVTRWARAGKISAIRTLGGHRRFKASRDPQVPRAGRREPSIEAVARAAPGSPSATEPTRAEPGRWSLVCWWPGPASIR